MKDKELKEKLESVDALSGGIVYGKEEAWDKLQARMDRKPVRRIALWQRLAAAAVLLLSVSILGYYSLPEKQIARTEPTPTAEKQDTETLVVSMPATQENTETIVPEQATVTTPIKKETNPIQYVVNEQKETTPLPQPVDTLVIEPAIAVKEQPRQVIPTVKKMRVVHINDIGRPEEAGAGSTFAYSGPSLDISKMKVVSINDVQREESARRHEEEIMTIVRINRPHGSFFQLPGAFSKNNSYDRSFAQNPLTIRFNRNN